MVKSLRKVRSGLKAWVSANRNRRLLTVEVGGGMKAVASCRDPSYLQMHKICAKMEVGNVMLVVAVLKGGVTGDCGTNGGFRRPNRVHGEGKKFRRSGD